MTEFESGGDTGREDFMPASIFIPLQEPGSAFFTYFGGMRTTSGVEMSVGQAGSVLEFDSPLPLSGVAFVPGTIAIDVSGVYMLSYEITFSTMSYTGLSARVLALGKPVAASEHSVASQRGSSVALTHSTLARLSAFDELELELYAARKTGILIRQAQMTIMRIGI